LILLLVGHLPINLCVSPQIAVQTAADRVKVPALVTLVMGLCNLLTAVFFVRCMHWGAWGVAAAGAIVLTCKNAFFTPAYTAHILHARLRLAYCGMGVSGVTAVATACFALTIGTWLPGANLLRLTVATTVALALGSVFVLAVVLNPSERGDLMARLHLRR
jgi:membrane protein EpsK